MQIRLYLISRVPWLENSIPYACCTAPVTCPFTHALRIPLHPFGRTSSGFCSASLLFEMHPTRAQPAKTCGQSRGDLPRLWYCQFWVTQCTVDASVKPQALSDCFCLPELKFISFFKKFSTAEKFQVYQNRNTRIMNPHVPTTSLQQFLFFFPVSLLSHT